MGSPCKFVNTPISNFHRLSVGVSDSGQKPIPPPPPPPPPTVQGGGDAAEAPRLGKKTSSYDLWMFHRLRASLRISCRISHKWGLGLLSSFKEQKLTLMLTTRRTEQAASGLSFGRQFLALCGISIAWWCHISWFGRRDIPNLLLMCLFQFSWHSFASASHSLFGTTCCIQYEQA